MSKIHNINIGRFSLHFGSENMLYLIPTIGIHRLDWREIFDDGDDSYLSDKISYVLAIKWLKWSCGVSIKVKVKRNKGGENK
jgi:hypothetical protein